jgi:hypothetical protein
LELIAVKVIIHHQEHVYIVRFGFVGHERALDDETQQVSSRRRQSIDAIESFANGNPLRIPGSESGKRLFHCRWMHTEREFAMVRHFR